MPVLQRHQLVYPTDVGWHEIQARHWDDTACACLAHWASRHLPLVVTQQRASLPGDLIALGLPAPTQWQRRKLALQLARDQVLSFADFPCANTISKLLKPSAQPGWLCLCATLMRLACTARVHGSYGWQQLSELAYLHDASDIDLHLSVSSPTVADAVAAALQSTVFNGPRLDGELVFSDGTAVAWREWLQWRAGKVDRILVKRLTGAAMETGDGWLAIDECLAC